MTRTPSSQVTHDGPHYHWQRCGPGGIRRAVFIGHTACRGVHVDGVVVMETSARDEALLNEIAQLFELYASDSRAMAARGYSKRVNMARAVVWEEAAANVRSIRLMTP